jgi:hypothetical protein
VSRSTSGFRCTPKTARFTEAPAGFANITGVYDLTAVITSSDPAWGIEDGTRQTAVLTIQHSRGSRGFEGTFADLRAIAPSGDVFSSNATPGIVIGTIDRAGRVVIELFFDRSRNSYWYGEGTVASRQIVGKFGAGGHISGTFTAERRPPE